MRTPILKLTAAFAFLLALAGCQIWRPGGVTAKSKDGLASISVPAGWVFTTAAPAGKSDLLATKDGALLQCMTLKHHDLKDPLPNSKRTLKGGQSAFELAEAVADDLRANREMLALKAIESMPVEIGGHSGFRLVVEYGVAHPTGLKIREAHYGVIVGTRLYDLSFAAPARHYFGRDLPAFDAAAKSLQISAQ
ncbi:MAG: hypothetical protein C0502_01965 [Opitutus sp.]|nr:hypothetical protein [Opitutus sp.]